MISIKPLALLLGLLFASPALAQLSLTGAGLAVPAGGGGGGTGSCSQSTAFFARTSASHTAGDPLDTLICASVTHGWFVAMDAYYVRAQANAHDALLNIVSTSFTSSAVGSPTFTGCTGSGACGYSGGSSGNYVDTGYNPATGGVQYTQTAQSTWVATYTGFVAATDYGAAVGQLSQTPVSLYPHFSDNTFYYNSQSTAGDNAGTTHQPANLYGADRAAALIDAGYKDGYRSPGLGGASTTILSADLTSLTDWQGAGNSQRPFSGNIAFEAYGGSLAAISLALPATMCNDIYTYMHSQNSAYATNNCCTAGASC